MIHKDIEMALALAMDMVEGTISRRQAEDRLVEEQTARGLVATGFHSTGQ